jgi:hypothetical protein
MRYALLILGNRSTLGWTILAESSARTEVIESIAHGKVWIDAWDTSDTGGVPPKRISGKYEIDLNGKHLQGSFVAKEHSRERPLRLCM